MNNYCAVRSPAPLVYLDQKGLSTEQYHIIRFGNGWEFGMKTKVNLNFKLLVQCVVLSLMGCAALFGGAYLCYLVLAAVFSSAAVFFSLFAVSVSLGVLFLYDADAFQWDNNPRIIIKRFAEVRDDE